MPDEPTRAPPLSPRMRTVLAPAGPPFGQPKANKREAEAIRAILAGRDRAKADIALGRAMRVLAYSDPSDETAAAIAKVLADARVEAGIRRQAVALLGDVPAKASVRALLGELGKADPPMEFEVLRALARVGDARASEAIEALPKTDSPALARARGFARTAILYRLGAEVDKKAEQCVMPRGTPLPIKRATPEAIARTIAAYRGSTYGIRFQRALGFAMVCEGYRHAILLDEGVRLGQLIRDLRAKRRIAGIVAMDDRSTGQFLPRRIILTRPDGDGVAVSVVRPSGEVALFGALRPNGKGLALVLRNHGGERVPTLIEGNVTDAEIVLSGRLFPETAAPKRRPQAIVPPG